MDHDRDRTDASTLLDYVRLLRRRKWIVLQATLLVPLAAVLFSLRQAHVYEAEADVLISNSDLAAALTGTQQQTGVYLQADRVAQTQADLARVPDVASSTLAAAGVTDMTAQEFLASSSVSPKSNADLLEFKVRDRDPQLAATLASEYARQFRIYRQKLDTAALTRARQEVQKRLKRLRSAHDENTSLYSNLVEKEQQLATLAALQTSNAYVVRTADGASQVQPRPVRNGILGLLLGLVLGVGLAFLREALDTRVRSGEEIGRRLRVPMLGRLPAPPKRLRTANRLAMLQEPTAESAETFRMLRTSVDFSNLDRGARTLMITSAVEGEGKSTTAANLAVAFVRAGKRVLLVDLDLRRPFIHRFFDAPAAPGVTDVALGVADLRDAIKVVSTGEAVAAAANGNGRAGGVLELLMAGTAPPDPGEFLATHALATVMEKIAARADVVIVDSPPLLHVGDAMTLSAHVDAIVLVARLQTLRRPMLNELERLLAGVPAAVLGFVVTGAEAYEGYGYGYGYSGYAPARPERVAPGERVP